MGAGCVADLRPINKPTKKATKTRSMMVTVSEMADFVDRLMNGLLAQPLYSRLLLQTPLAFGYQLVILKHAHHVRAIAVFPDVGLDDNGTYSSRQRIYFAACVLFAFFSDNRHDLRIGHAFGYLIVLIHSDDF
jgi:hypothetical protein